MAAPPPSEPLLTPSRFPFETILPLPPMAAPPLLVMAAPLIACGNSVASFSMDVRFLTGPAVMAAAAIAVGVRGRLLHIAIVQAALPQDCAECCPVSSRARVTTASCTTPPSDPRRSAPTQRRRSAAPSSPISVYTFQMLEEEPCKVAVLRQRRDGNPSRTYEHGFRVGFKGNYQGSKEEKYFINNHLSFRVMYHRDPESDTARMVGFEVTPNSIKHEYQEWDEKNPQVTTRNANTKNLAQGSTVPQEVDTKEVVFTYVVTFVESDIKWASNVFIELFFILNSIWLNQFYYIFGFLFIAFVILLITCAEITIVLCYFQLCSEDYNWWWMSYLTAGSSALYLFLCSVFYFYFGYMTIVSYARPLSVTFIFSSKSDFIMPTSTHTNVVISWNRLTTVSLLLVLDCSMVAYSILTSLGSCIARVFGLAGFWFHWSLQCISIASPLHGCPLDFFKSTRGFFLMVTQALSSNLGRAEFRNLFQVASLWVSVIVCIKHRRSFAAIFVSIWSSCSAAASHMIGELEGIHTASPGVVDLFASKAFDYLPQQASSTDLPLKLLSFSYLSLASVCTFCLHDCPSYWIRHDIILFLRICYVSCVIVYSY